MFKLLYFKDPDVNFGDDLNKWLWEQLLPARFSDQSNNWVSVIGTIINKDLMPPAERKVVFSSGFGYGHPPSDFGQAGWEILCVRGPLTAEALGLPQDKAITDGAILLAALPEYAEIIPMDQREGVLFMPHRDAFEHGQWEKVLENTGIDFISPKDDPKETIERIRKAKLVICDAMHAAIVSDTFRTPWIPVVGSSNVNTFKWVDWCASMNMNYIPMILPSSSLSEHLVRWSKNLFRKAPNIVHDPSGLVKSAKNKIPSSSNTLRSKIRPRHFLAKNLPKLVSIFANTKFIKKIESRFHEKCASELKKVSVMFGYLSEEKVYHDRLKHMQEKLNDLDRLIFEETH